jgi:hypothetical protein
VVNENYDYSPSTNTSRPYVKRQNMMVAGSAFALRRSHKATSGVLNRLHVDSTKYNNDVPNKFKKEKKEKEKEPKKYEKGHHKDQHEHQYVCREKESRTTIESNSNKARMLLPASNTPLETSTETAKHEISASREVCVLES